METDAKQNQQAPISQINVTPLVDVMLVLLIIFLVTASIGQQGIIVSLPQAGAAALDASEQVVTVTIDQELRIFINAMPVQLKDLSPRLRELYAHRQSKTVFLKADRRITYGDFVKVVSIIKDSGVEQLGMITEQSKE